MKNSGKIFLSLLVTVILITFTFPASTFAKTKFDDVSTTAEYKKHVDLMVEKKLVSGYVENGKTLYKPRNTLTRFHVAKILVEATGNGHIQPKDPQFSDLKPVGNHADTHRYLAIATQLGFIEKGPKNEINAYKPINRSDMAKATAKAFNLEQPVTQSYPFVFKDVSAQSVIAPAINGLYYAGVAEGSSQKFRPVEHLTRSQFALFIGRVMDEKLRLPLPHVALPFTKGEVFGTGSSLNVRSAPNDQAPIKGKLKDGDPVTLTKVHGAWYAITYLEGKQTGFVHSKFVKKYEEPIVSKPEPTPPEPKPEPTPEPELPVPTPTNLEGKVTVNGLNIRQTASVSSSVVGKLNRGDTVFVHSLNGHWAHISTLSGTKGHVSKTYLKLKNTTGNPLQNRIIVIDAGHGGSDPGAQSAGVNEKDITLKVSKLVEQKLKNLGANVKMTRTADNALGLSQRTAYAKQVYGETFVSIHVNSFKGSQANGTETFFDMTTNENSAESRQLATLVQNNIVKDLNMTNRGVKTARFVVLRESSIPSILIELGFITNAKDRDKMTNAADLNKFADAIVNGIYGYYSN